MSVVIETTIGDITVDLFVNERAQTCMNFIKLCKLKYYNLNLFHSVNANFCAQTGDPTGKGDGGSSIHGILKGDKFRLYQGETQPKIRHDRPGLISMVSHGNGMLGSQFIITLSANLGSLDGEHCVFGEVVEGSEVLLKLNETITDEQHRPYQDVRITHTVVLEDPFPDPEGMMEPPASPSPPSTLDAAYSRLPADEPLTETYTQEELNEMVQAREAAARATILEMVGDLPSADMAPPENVLFVCKLNPVTTDHDLCLIFSRFGKVKSCEVIKDAVTGDSLQYAFVEFEDKKSCEEAYFKMDNVLIDERRIHVDFSQSVAKWRGKGKGVEMLVPPPPGGWGNKSRNLPKKIEGNPDRNHASRSRGRMGDKERDWDGPRRDRRDERHERHISIKKERSPEKERTKNGAKSSDASKNKLVVKKEIGKKRKRRSPSSSSSSETSSDSSSTSESSSESEPVKKKSRGRKTEKVLVVVKTPRGKKSKKNKKIKQKLKEFYGNEVELRNKKKGKLRKRAISNSDSSSDASYSARKKKRKTAEKDRTRMRRKKRTTTSESSSDDSSEEEVVRKEKHKNKMVRRKKGGDSSDDEKKKKRKHKAKHSVRSREARKKRVRVSSASDSTSTSDSD